MTQHTPRPWEARQVSQQWTEILGDEDKSGKTIIAIVNPAGDDSEGRWTFPQRDANARLIAAAPELLQTLSWIAEEAHRAANGAGDAKGLTPGQLKQLMRAFRDDARAAIAKATGG